MDIAQTEKLSRLLVRCGHFMFHQTHQGGQQDKVISILQEKGPMPQKALQEKLGIQSGSVSELVTKLETKGLISRENDPADRRRVVLKLTEKGLACHRFHAPRPADTRFAALSEEECAQLETILLKLSESWEQ